MTRIEFMRQVNDSPGSIEFNSTMEFISQNYVYKPVRFVNGLGSGAVINNAGTNEGSCKIFALAKLLDLDEQSTLACFGRYYRDDVLSNSSGEDHANIRNFMQYGWAGIKFYGEALAPN
ncbi:MAG: hypothetical protein ACJA0M_000333 [Chitinophagales bacterium]|jgi:hypothetical protein